MCTLHPSHVTFAEWEMDRSAAGWHVKYSQVSRTEEVIKVNGHMSA